jgi:hypothetical protein
MSECPRNCAGGECIIGDCDSDVEEEILNNGEECKCHPRLQLLYVEDCDQEHHRRERDHFVCEDCLERKDPDAVTDSDVIQWLLEKMGDTRDVDDARSDCRQEKRAKRISSSSQSKPSTKRTKTDECK